MRRRAKRLLGLEMSSRSLESGAVSVLQRFGDGARLNPHIHALVLDGVYAPPEGHQSHPERFHPLPPPDDDEIGRIALQIAAKTKALLLHKAMLSDDGEHLAHDPLADAQPLLAAVSGASITSRVAMGPRAGQPLQRIADQIDLDQAGSFRAADLCASVAGFNLHAAVSIPAHDRARLERLSRYLLRPPFATERLSLLDDGRVLYRLKRRFRDGTHSIVFDGVDFISKLAALIPPPRANQVRYAGVFAPCHPWRDPIVGAALGAQPIGASRAALGRRIRQTERSSEQGDPTHTASSSHPLPTPIAPDAPDAPGDSPGHPSHAPPAPPAPSIRRPRPRRLAWSELLRRTFRVDLMMCPRCGGPRRIVEVVADRVPALRLLSIALPSRAPPAKLPPGDP